MTKARRRAEARGRRGETLAAWFLRLQGWRVLGRRVRTPRGEVDLVVRRGRTVCFVEVKWRRDPTSRDLAIDSRRLRRVESAVEVIAARYARPGDSVRIDVLLLSPGRWPRRIENASQFGA
ncbi:hypothetical protein B2G71_18170 [Novosphingobium sp. PC22D]|uniref:YraN family protein n=1 Tax=Novosphingobium sp. PC22D TaxID=1962403 RepID=UPI000BF1E2C1|nr:YraN family protein [Novosphingobium sp. PC22D]PEQ11214.1 hypothetical protein B2G71_18170 [Novosphingobium sp. PC22D]